MLRKAWLALRSAVAPTAADLLRKQLAEAKTQAVDSTHHWEYVAWLHHKLGQEIAEHEAYRHGLQVAERDGCPRWQRMWLEDRLSCHGSVIEPQLWLRYRGCEWPATQRTILMGKAPDSEIWMPSSYVGFRHAVIFLEDGCWTFQNLGLNGSLANGERKDWLHLNRDTQLLIPAEPPSVDWRFRLDCTVVGRPTYRRRPQ